MVSATPGMVHTRFAGQGRGGLIGRLSELAAYPGKILRHHLLVQNFFRRELLGRFRGSFLGVAWVLVHPLFLFLVYFLVFGFLFATRFTPGQGPDPNFAIYLFSGIVIYTSLLEATTRSCTVVVDNGNLVKKVAFPCELLPVHLVLVSLMVYLVGVVVMMAVGIFAGVVVPGLPLLALPLVLLVHFTLCVGMGLLLACVHVFMRDTVHIWGIVGQAGMFLSPVFWSLESGIGERMPAPELLMLNPVHALMQAHRISLGVTPGYVDGTLGGHLLVAGGWGLALLFVGHSLFLTRREKFADLV